MNRSFAVTLDEDEIESVGEGLDLLRDEWGFTYKIADVLELINYFTGVKHAQEHRADGA